MSLELADDDIFDISFSTLHCRAVMILIKFPLLERDHDDGVDDENDFLSIPG